MATAERTPPRGSADAREREYARRFAKEHEHFVEDLGFWRAAVARLGGPVLDVGCATGRLVLVLARDGHEVVAVDASQPMLDELGVRLSHEESAVARRVCTVRGRMQDFALGRRFRAVLVTMNTLQLLLTPEERARAMRRLGEHVAPDGELLLDVARLSVAEVRGAIGTEVPIAAHRRSDGVLQAQVARYEALDERTRTLEFSINISEAAPGMPITSFLRHHVIHMYLPGEIDELAERAGLRVLEVAGDFRGGPATGDADHQIYRIGRGREGCRGRGT